MMEFKKSSKFQVIYLIATHLIKEISIEAEISDYTVSAPYTDPKRECLEKYAHRPGKITMHRNFSSFTWNLAT